MSNRKANARRASRWSIAVLAIPISGCMAYNHTTGDLDRTPIVNTGTRASIIYPGQGAPAMPGSVPQTQYAPPGAGSQYAPPGAGTQYAPPPQSPQPYAYPPGASLPPGAAQAPQPYGNPSSDGSAQSAPTAQPYAAQQSYGSPPSNPTPDDQITFLGGSRTEETRHVDKRKEPLVVKYMSAPFKLLAAPFVLAKEAIEGDPEPGPAIPRRPDPQLPEAQANAAVPPRPQPTDYESAQLQNLERQLDQRAAAQPSHAPAQQVASVPKPPLSIADELRELQRTPDAPSSRPAPSSSAAPSGSVAAPLGQEAGNPYPTASGIVDRNNDGRIDQWIFRENGEISKQVLDEDFDGRPDRTIVFDPQTHRPSRVEEDTSGDGVIDSWTDYNNGVIARRRSDSNGDGTVDTWSFFRDGELARHEQDTTGDGFRDVVSFFEAGHRVREERDSNGDGQPDAILFYDGNEQLVRTEEDRDGDGALEVVSYYENGRLVRRELLETPTPSGRFSEVDSDEAIR